MSQIHSQKDFVLSVDIKEFFPSITQTMLEEMYTSLGFGPSPARVLSELGTYKAYVPQGALTSPKISNIIASVTFGTEIHEMCKDRKLTLSIYADDITMSGSLSDIPIPDGIPEEEKPGYYRAYFKETIDIVRQILEKHGFRLNKEKTKIMRRHHRQWVCGAVVNDCVNMIRSERMRLRAIVHNCERNGVEVEAKKAGLDTLAFIRKYAGRLNWYHQLNPERAAPLCSTFKKVTAPLTKMYPAFEVNPLAYSSSIESVTSSSSAEPSPF